MKKLALIVTLLTMFLAATGCVSASNQNHYESAQLCLGAGEYAYAADLFRQLGEYADSASYALYCDALLAIEDEDDELAQANLTAIHPFKSSGLYLAWLEARATEADGDLEKAQQLYAALGTFQQSHLKAADLAKDIPEAALQQGRKLMQQGEYAAARDIFLTLSGNAAASLAENCLRAMLAPLDEEAAAATLITAETLAEKYEATGLPEAMQRADELRNRFGVNLDVLTADLPYILLEDATLWQVSRTDGTVLTLRFVGMMERAEAPATATDLPMTVDLTPEGVTIRIDLAEKTFTEGDGTPENPFR